MTENLRVIYYVCITLSTFQSQKVFDFSPNPAFTKNSQNNFSFFIWTYWPLLRPVINIGMHGQFAKICGNPTPELFDFLGKIGSHKYPNKRSRKYFILDFFCRANSKIDWRFWSRKGYKNVSMYIMVKIFAWDKPWAQVNWQKICDFSQIKFTRSCDICTHKKR